MNETARESAVGYQYDREAGKAFVNVRGLGVYWKHERSYVVDVPVESELKEAVQAVVNRYWQEMDKTVGVSDAT